MENKLKAHTDEVCGRTTTTPMSATMIQLLGAGSYCDGVRLSTSETESLCKAYSIVLPPARRKPTGEDYGDGPEYTNDDQAKMGMDRFYEAGALRNMFRAAKHDGLRSMAVLAKHLNPEEDPVKFLIRLLNDAGYDHPDDFDWACEDES